MFVDFNILNQLGSPSINSNTFANRPAAGQTGRLFVSTDTFEIYRDNGTTWDLIGGPGSSTITGTGTATQVAYFTSSQAIGSSANLFWDNTSGFLGVATATPTARIEAVKTDGVGIYANFTTNAGSGSSTTALWAKNVTNGSGFSAVIEETTPNTTAGQYPLLIKHSLSSGTAGVGMGTGIHWQLPDDAGTFKTTQLTIETINAAAATYATRYRFNVQSNGSSTPVAYINSTGLGIFTATPGVALDIHSTGIMAHFNTTSATGNTYIAFQRTGTNVWRLGDQYNAGANFFQIHNTALSNNAIEIDAATNKSIFTALQTYTTGLARGNYFDYNLSVAAGGSFSSPNAITALGASLDLTLAGSATIPSGARSGLDAYNSIGFTGTGTLTHNQGTQIRAYSNLTAGWAFNGSATGTITHLAGLRALFPDNTGSAVTVTNNYALLLNDQTANTGTVTYTNRWGVYQEGASDLNYFAANTLIGTTVNNGNKLQVSGTGSFGYVTNNTNAIVLLDGNLQQSHLGSAFGATFIQNNNYYNGSTYVFDDNTQPSSNITLSNGTLNFQTGIANVAPSTKMTLNLAGNLGLAVTPSAWGSGYLGFQVGPAGSQMAYLNNNFIGVNYYFDGSNYKAIQTGTASRIEFSGNAIEFKRAASVSANANQTFDSSAILDASGNLGIGENSPTLKLVVSSSSAGVMQLKGTNGGNTNNTQLRFFGSAYNDDLYAIGTEVATGTTNRAFDIYDLVASTPRFRISTAGNVLIGTTTDNGRKLQVNGSGTFTGTGFDSQSAEIHLINTTATTGKTFVLNATNSGGFQVADKTAGGATRFFIDTSGNSEFSGSIKTDAPTSGTSRAWKLGARVGATVVLDTTQYIEVEVAGNFYKLAVVT